MRSAIRGTAHAFAALLALSLATCTTLPDTPPPPGHQPDPATSEGGLWQQSAEAEARLANSRFRIRDPGLDTYVNDIACRLSPDTCGDIYVYLTRNPYFNATMLPNGAMNIWSGLLLRVQNEAQLAAIIGHEIGHYLERHSLKRLADIRTKADLNLVLGMGMAVAGAPPAAADATRLGLVASIFAYSRENEREADAIGLELMRRAGYATIEAGRVWEQLLAEEKAYEGRRRPGLMFATHPTPEERLETLRAAAEPGGETHRTRYLETLEPLRSALFEEELALANYDRTLALFDLMSNEAPDDPILAFYTGEAHRLRGDTGDMKAALAAYERAVAIGDAPVGVHRSIGLVQRRLDRPDQARAAFEHYLDAAPDAPDRAMIEAMMNEAPS